MIGGAQPPSNISSPMIHLGDHGHWLTNTELDADYLVYGFETYTAIAGTLAISVSSKEVEINNKSYLNCNKVPFSSRCLKVH